MKFCIIVLLAISFYSIEGRLTEEQILRLARYRKECVESSNVDLAVIEQVRAGKFTDDSAIKEYAKCVAKKEGFIDDSGNIQKDVLIKKASNVVGEALAKSLLDECIVERGDIGETNYGMIKCFYAKSPEHFLLI